MRLCAYPFPASVAKFIADHDKVFIVEQNRDAQMHTLLVESFAINPAKLEKVLHYDGTPITARFIIKDIKKHLPPAVTNPAQQKEAA